MTSEIMGTAWPSQLLGEDFYLVVPARVSAHEAMDALQADGLMITREYHPQSLYGAMDVYHFEKIEDNGALSA